MVTPILPALNGSLVLCRAASINGGQGATNERPPSEGCFPVEPDMKEPRGIQRATRFMLRSISCEKLRFFVLRQRAGLGLGVV